ncbi:MAG: hypothetical protein R3321_08210, partial [Nitrososphaeraceae archaeon]|nr:hypothetical protein [Nitrososphaeraceae archaeon]
MKNISIIGCGAIGSELAHFIDTEMCDAVKIISIFDLKLNQIENIKANLKNNDPEAFTNFSLLISSDAFKKVDLVIESASQSAVKQYLKSILLKQKDILIMSVGSFADSNFFSDVIEFIHDHGNNIYIPSGAIAGIDAIK